MTKNNKKRDISKVVAIRGSGGGGGPSYTDDNLFSVDRVEFLIGISEGPIKGIYENSLKNVYLGDTPVMSPTGELNFELDDISVLACKGTSEQEAWRPIMGGSAQFHNVNISLPQQNQHVIRQVPNKLAGNVDRIDINLMVQRLVHSNEDGTDNATLDVLVEYRVPSKGNWLSQSLNLRGKTTGGYKTQVSFHGLREYFEEGDILELRVTRVSKDSDSNYMADVTWLGYDTVTAGQQIAHADLAQLHLYANSSEQFSGTPSITAIWEGLMVPVPTNYNPETRHYDETSPWDGSFTVEKYWTDNPIWLVRELVRNSNFGLAAYNKYIRISEYSWYDYAKYCDELVPNGRGGKQPRYTLNYVIQTIRDGADFLNYLLSSCNALVKEGFEGFLTLYADRPTSAVAVITPEMVQMTQQGVQFNYQYTDVFSRANEVRAQFINPNNDWSADFVSVKHQPAIDKYGLVVEEFEALGCIDSHEATRKAMHRLISAQTETCTVSFTLNRMGITLEPFQIFLLADPSRHWAESRRADTYHDRTITVKDPVYFEQSGSYVMQIATVAGTLTRTVSVPSPGYHSVLTINKRIDVALAEHFAFVIEGQGQLGNAKAFRVLRCDPTDGYGGTWAVTAVEVNRNKWTAADNVEFIDIPNHSYVKPTDPPKILNLQAWIERENVEGVPRHIVKLTWDTPSNHPGLNHKIYLNANGGGMVLRGETRGNEFEIRDLDYGMYALQVVTTSMYGTGESDVITLQSKPSNALDWLENQHNLTITATPTFVGADLLVDVDAVFERDGWPIDIIATGEVAALVFKVHTPDIIKEHRVTSKQWLYRYAQMITDFNGNPPADIRISVYISDHKSRIAGPHELHIVSEGNPSVTALKVMARDVSIGAVPLWNKPDITEPVDWYISETNQFATADLIGTTAKLDYNQVAPSTQYYLWAVYRPAFGVVQYFPSPTTGLSVNTLALSEVILPELEGSIGLDILDSTLKDKITHIDAMDESLLQQTEAIKDVVSTVDSLADSTTQAFTDIDTTIQEINSNIKEVENVKNHLTDIEKDVEAAKDSFDKGLAQANDKLDQAQADIAGAKDQITATEDKVNQTQTEMGDLSQNVDQQLASTQAKVTQVEGNLADATAELNKLIGDNYAEYIEFRDSIIHIDPDTGNITLEALEVLKTEMRQEFKKVGIRLDSVEASIETKASKLVVDAQGQTLTTVEQRLSAAEGLISNKASIESVQGNTTKLNEVSQEIDAVKGSLTNKAESALVNEQGQRLAAAEDTLKAHTSDIESLAEKNSQLSASLDGVDQKLTAGLSDLSKVVATEKEATAQRFTELKTEVGDVKSSISELSKTVNDGQTATNQQLESMQGVVGQNAVEITELKETVVSHNQASTEQFNQLNSTVNSNKASISELNKTVSTLDSSLSQQIGNLSSEVDGAQTEINSLKETNANEHSALAKDISDLAATVTAEDKKLAAQITSVSEASATADSALAQRIDQLTSKVDTDLGEVNASITESVKTLTDADKALAQQLNNLASSVTEGDQTLAANIRELAETVATSDEAMAQQLNELATSVDKNEANIKELNKVVTGSDSSLAEIFQGIMAQLDIVADTSANTSTGLDSEVQDRIKGQAEIKRGQKVLVDKTGALAQTIEELKAEFEQNGVITEGAITNLQTVIANQEKALAQAKQELTSAIAEGDRKLSGQIASVSETVSTLEQTVQTQKETLEGQITEGDKALQGSIETVNQNLVELDKTVQTQKETLESQITDGDKTLQGSINSVSQNLVDLEKSVQTLSSTLEGQITEGDKQLQSAITNLSQVINTTAQSLAQMFQELSATFETVADTQANASTGLDAEVKQRVTADASIKRSQTTLANEQKAQAEQLLELEANFKKGDAEINAGLTQLEQVVATDKQALATVKRELTTAITEGDKAVSGKVSEVSQSVSDLEHTMQTHKETLEGQIADGDRALQGSINNVSQNVVELEKTLQSTESKLEGQISEGDKVLQGSINSVSQNLVNLEKTVQTQKETLESQISDGDRTLQGSINTVNQNVVDLEKTVQSQKETLESQIAAGDKALQGSISKVTQNVVDLDKSMQSLGSNLSNQISEGDKTVSGQVNQVAQTVSNLSETVSQVQTSLEGKIQDQGEELSAAIEESMKLAVGSGEVLVELDDFAMVKGSTHNKYFSFSNSAYETTFPAIIKLTVENLPTNSELKVNYNGSLFTIKESGNHSLTVMGRQGNQLVQLVNRANQNITIKNLRLNSQESRSHFAQWGIKSTVGGLQGGIGFVNDGSKVVFAMDVDQFVMLDRKSGNELVKAPFYVQNNQVYIAKAAIKNADIAEILKVGTRLYAPYIANREGANPEFYLDGNTKTIQGGHLRGGDLAIGWGGSFWNWHTHISSNGTIYTDRLHMRSSNTGTRLELNGDRLEVWENNSLRVRLGRL